MLGAGSTLSLLMLILVGGEQAFFILRISRVHSVFKQEGVVVRGLSLFKVMAAAVADGTGGPKSNS